MSIITQTQSPVVKYPTDAKSSGAITKNEQASSKIKEAAPSINKMSQQLNQSNPSNSKVDINQENVQNFVPDTGSAMIGVQSGNITAEFVANLLNKNPYEN